MVWKQLRSQALRSGLFVPFTLVGRTGTSSVRGEGLVLGIYASILFGKGELLLALLANTVTLSS